VKDVARAYVRSAERLLEQLERGETGTETYEIASDEDMSVMEVAEIVREAASGVHGIDVDVGLVENPRSAETMVEEFGVDTSVANEQIGWVSEVTLVNTIRKLLDNE
jgi:UDP-glucose 4-epimerase